MKLTSSNLLIISVLVAVLSGCNTYYYTPMPGASPGMPAAQAEAICKAELQREKEKATRDAYQAELARSRSLSSSQSYNTTTNCVVIGTVVQCNGTTTSDGDALVESARQARAKQVSSFAHLGPSIAGIKNCMAAKGFQQNTKEPKDSSEALKNLLFN
jgi:hypothetical protein